MDGKGHWTDNVIIERFWRTIKYEDNYLKSCQNPIAVTQRISKYILKYNAVRPCQGLLDMTPDEMYYEQQRKAA